MGKNRYVNTEFWKDEYIQTLNSNEKLLFIYFLTNGSTNVCGIYKISIRTISFDTLLSEQAIKRALKKFGFDHKIYYCNGWIRCVNFMKNQNIKNRYLRKGMFSLLSEIPKEVCDMLGLANIYIDPVKENIKELLPELIRPIINDMENKDSSRRLRTPQESLEYNIIKSNSIKLNKNKNKLNSCQQPVEKLTYGEHKNIFLTKEEYLKLFEEYGECLTVRSIEKLSNKKLNSEICQKYDSDYGALKTWVIAAVKKEFAEENKYKGKEVNNNEKALQFLRDQGITGTDSNV